MPRQPHTRRVIAPEHSPRRAPPPAPRRCGLTQSELAGERFSKEYVSQIERGKTRPTDETIGWLAARLGVDTGFLSNGVSSEDRGRVEATLARAEALLGAGSFADAAEAFEIARAAVGATSVPSSTCARSSERPARASAPARSRGARPALPRAHARRGPILLGRRARGGAALARRLPLQALQHPDRARAPERVARPRRALGLPCDRLRADVYNWRARCYRRQRDFEAAREDVETALELAEGLNDRRALANAYFQASLVAERQGHWLLARTYAERAKAQYEELADQANVGQLMTTSAA